MCDASGPFGIVGVDHVDVVEPQDTLGFRDGFFQAGRARNVVARRQQMTGIETEAHRQIRHTRREFADRRQLFEAPANLRARAHRALGQQHQFAELQTGRRLRRFPAEI